MNYITFDIETYSPSDLNHIDTKEYRASVVGAFISWLNNGQGAYIAFLEKDIKQFLDLLKQVDLVIGYNQLWFDLPVLQKYSSFDLLKLPNYDILVKIEEKIGGKLKLNDVCKANFDNDLKTDSYSVYRHYHKQNKWLELIDYCMNDVRLTQALFQQILTKKVVHYYDLHILKTIEMDNVEFGKVNIVDGADSIF
jgi:DNA polymerase elongation subunit (family B)